MTHTTQPLDADPPWLRSSRCVAGECVEVRATADGIQVHDSKHPNQPPLAFTAAEWDAFVAGVKAGEFDEDEEDAPLAGEMCIFGQMSDSRGLERCVLPPRHEGLHRTASGREWTDQADNPGSGVDEIECPF